MRPGAALSLAGAALAIAGCPGAPTAPLYTPITGILVDSQTLTAGIGCGTAPGEVYRYAAVVYSAGPDGGPAALFTSGVFDCFANGQFSNLYADAGANTAYDLVIYAYDEPSFPAALAPCVDLPATPSGAPPACPGDVPQTVLKYAARATYTTTCTAVQQQGLSAVASCAPLEPPDAGPPESDAGPG